MTDLITKFAAASSPKQSPLEEWVAGFTPEVRAAWDDMLTSRASTQAIVDIVRSEGIPVGKDRINAHRKAARERAGRTV